MARQKQYRNEAVIKKIGANIRQWRISKGLSQEKLTFECDLKLSQINRIELGKKNTSISHLFLIAEKLKVSPEELIK